MFKLVLEKAEEPEIKLPTSAGSSKSKRVPEKHLFLIIDHAKAFDCVDHNKLWKILKEMGIPDHLTCLLRNQYAGQEATVRTGHGTTDWFQIGKGICQGCILSLSGLNVPKSAATFVPSCLVGEQMPEGGPQADVEPKPKLSPRGSVAKEEE